MRDKEDFTPSRPVITPENSGLKDVLRNIYIPPLVQSSDDSDGDGLHRKAISRAAKWWRKIDRRHFATPKTQDTKAQIAEYTSKNPTVLSSYLERVLLPLNRTLDNPAYVRVLFRVEDKTTEEERYELVSYGFSGCSQYAPIELMGKDEQTAKTSIISFRNSVKKSIGFPQGLLQEIALEPIEIETDKDLLHNLLRYEVIRKQAPLEIDGEIQAWSDQLTRVAADNHILWKHLELNIKNTTDSPHPNTHKQEVQQLSKDLRMSEITLLFKLGHADKTQQMLDDANQIMIIKTMNLPKKTKLQKMKILFDTDCKVCFCTESNEKNKVIYCDECNTSFHQICYGVQNINIAQRFYCDVCTFLKNETALRGSLSQGRSTASIGSMGSLSSTAPLKLRRKPLCQICYKSKFPMKLLDDHFYHVTCLILFNFVTTVAYELTFRAGLSHQALLEAIVANEMVSQPCSLCFSQCGMKLKCARVGCNKFYHPICAYLNGLHFEIVRWFRAVDPYVTCSSHHPQRDEQTQVYFRRFFCDFKNVSNQTEEEFAKSYRQELQERARSALALSSTVHPLIRKGKIQKTVAITPHKTKENNKVTPMTTSAEPVEPSETETRKLLRLFARE